MTEAAANQHSVQLTFGLFPDHKRTAELAERLVPDPAQHVAWAAVGCALDGLSFVAPATVEHMISLDVEGSQCLVRHLAQGGSNARWVSKFVPSIAPEADAATCAPHAFGHVKLGQRQQLRAAYAAWLRERTARSAPPIKIPPPPVTDRASTASAVVLIEHACLICSVGSQPALATTVAREGRANVARQMWTPKRTGTSQLGLAITRLGLRAPLRELRRSLLQYPRRGA